MTMEQAYLNLLEEVLHTGENRTDRTGVGTRSLFGKQIRCDLEDGFPALTTKKLFFKPCVAELLWFLEGTGDERRLAEIQYGTRDAEKTTIWTANAQADYWKNKARFDGDAGDIYGVQWRKWKNYSIKSFAHSVEHNTEGSATYFNARVLVNETDQIKKIINSIKNNPGDRRMILSAYNVGELDNMSLPPCHMFAQFYVRNLDNDEPRKLDCQVYIRSNDLFLGLPFNIASYALLVHMLAQVTGIKPGELVITIGDAHIYQNHIEQVKEQLSRKPIFHLPTLVLNSEIDNIDDFSMEDILLINYSSHPAIKAPMAV